MYDEPVGAMCRQVLEEFYAHLDNEEATLTIAEVRAHLDACAPCLRQADLEAMTKHLVHRSCACEAAPADLRMRIMTAITRVRY